MDRQAIETLLAPISGATFAALDTVTVPVLKGGKANPFQGKVEKHCLGSRVMLFTNKRSSGYENMVKRRLIEAGLNPASFECGPLPWGERIPDSPFIANKDKLYLQVIFLEAGEVEYRAKEDFYIGPLWEYKRGEVIHKSDIQGLDERTGSEHQGLERDRQVICRTYCIDSIAAIRAFGEELAG